MIIVHKEDPKWYCVLNRKCGSTSLKRAFLDNFDTEKVEKESVQILDLIKRTYGLESAHGFTIVRNPYARIVSFFHHKTKRAAKRDLDEGTYHVTHQTIGTAFTKQFCEKGKSY